MNRVVEIPPRQLAPETLRAIVEEFINREGTDYGFREISLPEKVNRVLRQIERGEVVIAYDFSTESCNLLTRNAFQGLLSAK